MQGQPILFNRRSVLSSNEHIKLHVDQIVLWYRAKSFVLTTRKLTILVSQLKPADVFEKKFYALFED